MSDDHTTRSLKEMLAEDSRPRERAMQYGFEGHDLADLLAVIIGSGSQGENVVELCRRILRDHDNKLYNVARRNYRELMRLYKGIGEVKALQILAAIEVARRYQSEPFTQRPQITDSRAAYDLLCRKLNDKRTEEVWVLLLDRAKRVTHIERIVTGATAMAAVEVKMIVKPAIETLADGLILAHNHPSDTPSPSGPDDVLTRKTAEACRAIDIAFLDHIIVCRGGKYYSYNDAGRL